MSGRISRRRLLQGGVAVFGSALVLSFRSLVGRTRAANARRRRVVVAPAPGQDIVFVEGVIVCRGGGTVRAFSATCPHLGCEIAREAEGLLVCPCHGSRFHLDGSVAKGPAARPLQALRCSVDPATGVVTVHGDTGPGVPS